MVRFNTTSLMFKSGYYFIINIIVYSISLITFSLQTKILSLNNYGEISIIDTSLLLITSLCSIALPQAYIRFYSLYKNKNNLYALNSGYIFVLFFTSFLTFIVCITYLHYFTDFHLLLCVFMGMASTIVVLTGALLSVFRAMEKTFIHACLSNLGHLLVYLPVVFLFILVPNTENYYIGYIIIQFFFLIIVLGYFKKIDFPYLSHFDRNVIKDILVFSLPLLVVGVSSTLLNSSNRYVVQYLLDEQSVAKLTVSQKLGNSLQNLLVYPINMLVYPTYIRLWENEGRSSTELFLKKSFDMYVYFAIPLMMGSIMLIENILEVITTSDYLDVSNMAVVYIINLIIFGAYYFLIAGLFIRKKTIFISYLFIIGAVVNLVLSYLFVLVFSLDGVPYAALFTYLSIMLVGWYLSNKIVRFTISIKKILTYLFMSIIMCVCIYYIPVNTDIKWLNLLIQIFIAMIVYFSLTFSKLVQIKRMILK